MRKILPQVQIPSVLFGFQTSSLSLNNPRSATALVGPLQTLNGVERLYCTEQCTLLTVRARISW